MTAICIFYEVYKENAYILSQQLKIPILKELKANETIICFGSAGCPKILLDFQIRNKVDYVIINGENLTSDFFSDSERGKQYKYLCKKNQTWQYSPYTADVLEQQYGIKCAGIYDWEFIKRTPLPTTIDILFYGFKDPNREMIESQLKHDFPQLNIKFAYNTYNDELIDLLLTSKYVLNIPHYEKSALETHRINQALACGCKVISKKSSCDFLNAKYASKITFVDEWADLAAIELP
jgi:hypothetical protein